MPAKKKKAKPPQPEHIHVSVRVHKHSPAVGASLNHEIDDLRRRHHDTPTYEFSSSMELVGEVIDPEERAGEEYLLSVYGGPHRPGRFDRVLGDFRVDDEDGSPQYKKKRGEEVPIYDPPKTVGYLQRMRGTG